MTKCTACERELDVMMFYSLTDGDDRYHSVCRPCRSNGVKEDPEILAEYAEAGIKSTGGWTEPQWNNNKYAYKHKTGGKKYGYTYKKAR